MPMVYPNYGPGAAAPMPLDGPRSLPAGQARPSPYGGPGLASERLVEPAEGLLGGSTRAALAGLKEALNRKVPGANSMSNPFPADHGF